MGILLHMCRKSRMVCVLFVYEIHYTRDDNGQASKCDVWLIPIIGYHTCNLSHS